MFEQGEKIRLAELTLPANITLSTFDQITHRLGTQPRMVSILELESYYFFFKRIKGEFLLAGLSAKTTNIELALNMFTSLESIVLKLFE